LIEYLGLGLVHVVGHSYGGLIALPLALDRPDLVGSLVLMEPALRVRAAGPASEDLAGLWPRVSSATSSPLLEIAEFDGIPNEPQIMP
jgi:pimeloyl-ACP methyl ester carboxylesterase